MCQLNTIDEILNNLILEEIHKTIKVVHSLKTTCFNGVPVEDLLHGFNSIAVELHHMISNV